ncbi:MAG: type III-A CRISPR-associated RAMP protein Csm3 [Synergistetes bacterium]|nr:type III-A CRISPR-associated RAMP protein Csm3 [Synergistota bacterium]MDW8192197.1 type III-A CRISPR-associated RAMP protein Csm3 [Synergistota bacterium]
MEVPKFIGRVLIEGKIEAKTGLRIGGSREVLEVGGLDLPVIKDPFGVPYIPGSSLKGKMRALLELMEGKGSYVLKGEQEDTNFQDFWAKYTKYIRESSNEKSIKFEGKPCSCGECNICKLFGIPANANKRPLNPTRLTVRDAFLDKDDFENKFKDAELLEFEYTEVKYENSIDRLTSAANPRQVERVPAGAQFNFAMIVKLLGEEEVDLLGTLATGMKLLEDDYLGGHGSRGYGAIEFRNLKIKFRSRSFYEGREGEKEVGSYKSVSEIKLEEIKSALKKLIRGESESK